MQKNHLQSKILIISVILVIGSAVMAMSSNQTAGKIKQELEQERYKRMVAEEGLTKTQSRISSLESELTTAKDKIQSVQAILATGKEENSDLKTELENVSKAKMALEKKIEELKNTQVAAAAAVPEQGQP